MNSMNIMYPHHAPVFDVQAFIGQQRQDVNLFVIVMSMLIRTCVSLFRQHTQEQEEKIRSEYKRIYGLCKNRVG